MLQPNKVFLYLILKNFDFLTKKEQQKNANWIEVVQKNKKEKISLQGEYLPGSLSKGAHTPPKNWEGGGGDVGPFW